MPLQGLQLYDLEGNLTGTTEVKRQQSEQLYDKYGKATVVLGWHEIRQLLFEYLPSGTVEFDKQV